MVERRSARHVDLIAAILLSIATVAPAWSAHQSTRWGGVRATSIAQASGNPIESSREYNRSMQVLNVDANLFVPWVNALNADDQNLLTFCATSLTCPSFLPNLAEWVASRSRENLEAMRNPLFGGEYQRELFAERERLRAIAEEMFVEASEANQTGDDCVFATVMFASLLSFGDI